MSYKKKKKERKVNIFEKINSTSISKPLTMIKSVAWAWAVVCHVS